MDAGVVTPNLTVELLRVYADRPRPRSVAVVGLRPMPADSARATAIDGCDLVIRVGGHVCDEPDGPPAVGRRTHAVVFDRALRATKWVFADYRSKLYLLVEPGPAPPDPRDLPRWWPVDLGFVPVPSREFTRPLSRALASTHPAETPDITDITDITDTGAGRDRPATGARGRQTPATGTVAAWIARTSFPDAELVLAGLGSGGPDPGTDPCPAEDALLDSWVGTGAARSLP
ncbi:hypothetical protein [Saccharomonospora halophila]|uniref:hypothetical protein n=1 Tax=Saccharomonospora halophila TaxID=129922 RepID=UPI000374398A|nr:hypothetical protein [Saccharomonospora halophila]